MPESLLRRLALGAAALVATATVAQAAVAPAAYGAEGGATAIGAGETTACYLAGGRVYCAGDGTPVPVGVEGLPVDATLIQVASGHAHTCVLSTAGRVYCWGSNEYGQLGDGTTTDRPAPVPVVTGGALDGVTLVQLTAGYRHTCAVSSAGRAYCWGADEAGQLGTGATGVPLTSPAVVLATGAPDGIVLAQIAAGAAHTCAVGTDGHAYCWGANGTGQLGDGTVLDSAAPVTVPPVGPPPGEPVRQVAAGGRHSCAITTTGRAWCWGDNSSGQLGDATTTTARVPTAVDTGGVLDGVSLARVAAGDTHTCALSSAGRAYCWGANSSGQLGDAGTTPRHTAVAVDGHGPIALQRLTRVTAGHGHTCVLSVEGRVYCWGTNGSGQLGDGTTADRPAPVEMNDAPGVPVRVTAVPGDARVTVSWRAPADLGSGTLVEYVATAEPSAATCRTAGTSCVITGLPNGVPVTVRVLTVTTGGRSGSGTAPEPVTPAVAPGTPTGVVATAGNREAMVSWIPPAPGSGVLTGYTVTATPGGSTCGGPDPHCVLTNLTNGVGYTVTVVAHSTHADSAPSDPPVVVTPVEGRPDSGSASQYPIMESSRIAGDFNGDGIDDVALFHEYGYGDVALFTMTGQVGRLDAPVLRWRSNAWGTGTRFVRAGDFDRDGRSDIGIFYDYGNGHLSLFTLAAHANGDGGFGSPVLRWDAPGWGTPFAAAAVGDYNADGYADLALFYQYQPGWVALWTMLAHPNGDGGFDPPVRRVTGIAWGSGPTVAFAGDYNGDAHCDLAVFYQYASGPLVSLFTLTAHRADDGFDAPVLRWSAPGWGTGTQLVAAGDYNSDGRTDIALLYHYGAGRVTLFTLTAHAGGDGGFDGPVARWSAPSWGAYTKFMVSGCHLGPAAGPDVVLFYDYGTGAVGVFTISASGNGNFSGPVTQWMYGAWGSGTRTVL